MKYRIKNKCFFIHIRPILYEMTLSSIHCRSGLNSVHVLVAVSFSLSIPVLSFQLQFQLQFYLIDFCLFYRLFSNIYSSLVVLVLAVSVLVAACLAGGDLIVHKNMPGFCFNFRKYFGFKPQY
jgi:hypothetical protein